MWFSLRPCDPKRTRNPIWPTPCDPKGTLKRPRHVVWPIPCDSQRGRNDREMRLGLHLVSRKAPETTPTCGLAYTLRFPTRPKRTRNAVWPAPCDPKGARNDPDTWFGLDLATHNAAGRNPKYGLAYTLRPETHPKRTRCVVWPTPCDPKRTRNAVWLTPCDPKGTRNDPDTWFGLVLATRNAPETNPKCGLAWALRPEMHPKRTRHVVWPRPCDPKRARNESEIWFGLDLDARYEPATNPTYGLAYTLPPEMNPNRTRHTCWPTPCGPKRTRHDPDTRCRLDLAARNAPETNPTYAWAYTLRPETHPTRTRHTVWPRPCGPKRTRHEPEIWRGLNLATRNLAGPTRRARKRMALRPDVRPNQKPNAVWFRPSDRTSFLGQPEMREIGPGPGGDGGGQGPRIRGG